MSLAIITMPIVNAESTWSNFKWFANCEVSDAVRDLLADLGFLWVMQRTPSSNAEKAIAGYEKRPDGFKRSSIEFSDENAELLKSELGKEVEIDENVKIVPNILNVIFHEIGKTVEPKYADEKKAVQRHIEAKDIVQWNADKVGYLGDGDLDTNNVEFLKAVKELKNRLLKEQM
jgi:hypothetical protein